MKHMLCAAVVAMGLVAGAGSGQAATVTGAVTSASGATSLTAGEAGSLSLTLSTSDGLAAMIYNWDLSGPPAAQFDLAALFTGVGGGVIESSISEGDDPTASSGSYSFTNTAFSFGGYAGSVYATFSATFVTPFDAMVAPTVQELLDVLAAGAFTFRIGNDRTGQPPQFFVIAEGGPAMAAVPLPATGAMLLAGAAVLAAAGRRRRGA